jgi:ABC-type multidrug transport system fused ATPase/permease subunit
MKRSFPHLAGLLRMIPRPRWAAPTLVILGILSSLAEGMGIALIPLLIYSAMNQLDFLASTGGLLGAALHALTRTFHSSREMALLFLLLIVMRGGLAYAYAMTSSHVSERISQSARDRVHTLYLTLPYRFIQGHEQAELVEALGREVPLFSVAYTSLTRVLVNSIFVVIFGTLLALLSWRIALCAMFCSLLLSSLLRLLSRRASQIGIEVKRIHRGMWDQMLVTIQGLRTIRAFGQQEIYQTKFARTSDLARDVIVRELQLILLLDPLTEVGYLVILGILVVGASSFGASFATTLTCVALLYRLQPHVRELEGTRLKLLQLEPQLQSVYGILQEGERMTTRPTGASIGDLKHSIRFENVSFRYQDGTKKVLDNVTFCIPIGKTTALVGESGSGKTTIVNLLLRLFDPEEGGLYIDDQPLKDLATADWLKLIAVAGQDIDLIDGTVIENIKMADIGASESAVDSVLDFVGFSEWLSSLPDGYNTLVGQHGTRFSGGQRQRIGMARAALHGPKFLVLDEAMNAMDSALEERMREAIDVRFGDATVLLITHQLESIRNADHVIVLRDGKVIYEGMPQERILENPSAR